MEHPIVRISEARRTRSTPDGNCPEQLHVRGRHKQPFCLPYYYLGMAHLKQLEQAEDPEKVCAEAKRFRWISLKHSEETYDAYSSRLARQMSDLDDILDTCGEDEDTAGGGAGPGNGGSSTRGGNGVGWVR